MLQITCVPLINSLPADIICGSFDLVVVQWNCETQTLRRAKSVLHARCSSPNAVPKGAIRWRLMLTEKGFVGSGVMEYTVVYSLKGLPFGATDMPKEPL